jgi:superfamily II DNA or RNA helicase
VISINEADIRHHFSNQNIQNGRNYWRQNRVIDLKTEVLSNGQELVMARVVGSGRNAYSVSITLSPATATTQHPGIVGECSCPMSYQCKHVVATLFRFINERPAMNAQVQNALSLVSAKENQNSTSARASTLAEPQSKVELPYELSNWLNQVAQVVKEDTVNSQCILYLLEAQLDYPKQVRIKIMHTRRLKNGGYGKLYPVSSLNGNYANNEDRTLLNWLNALANYAHSLGQYNLRRVDAGDFFRRLLQTGRCHWHSKDNPPLRLGDTRRAEAHWEVRADGSQHLQFHFSPELGTLNLLPLTPLWYVDSTENVCGEVDTGLPAKVAAMFLDAPALPPEQADSVRQVLSMKAPDVPQPQRLRRSKRNKTELIPHLYLFNHTYQLKLIVGFGAMRFFDDDQIELPQARLSFLYDGQPVPAWPESDAPVTYYDPASGELVEVARNLKAEAQARATFRELGLLPLAEYYFYNALQVPAENRYDHVIRELIEEEHDDDVYNALMHLSLEEAPRLRAQGWRIEMADDYQFRVVSPELIEEWYADIEEGSGIDWFGLELGVSVEGQRINLLPLLVEVLRGYSDPKDLAILREQADDSLISLRLGDGRLLPLPIGRVRHIIDVLVELYGQEPLDEDGRLRLQALRAAQLVELEAAMGAARLRWFGGERLLELGRKLHDFKGIEPVPLPPGFQTDLRHYQQEGLNWLQFLREYGLGGILADDMGLGKTVQTLAHLLTEKSSGRMDKPCLVIAPTSLMTNWRLEAQRFAPDLKVLTLHGPARKDEFTNIAAHDLILTTYPLLSRDKDALLKQQYHFLVLDEAQNIKNPKAKATQIVHQLQARHRLCLTGTPMENHLGELWSLCHFLMPGLLGDYAHFREVFRTPIEKQGDFHRREVLSRRVKPFMLRRAKQEVVEELPAKTEIVRSVEMDGAQLDLYETIRLTMHEKVRQEIAAKGMARSQIVILDALLKLRQVCCDPRLVKLEAAKKVKHSAKLALLMDLLPEMVAEGRKILLFSQFTSMLSLIEKELSRHKLAYVKLTGQTRNRAEMIQAFQEGDAPLFLISLKAGGTGLNLTAADTVIHYDPWWNPAVENQATDRAHRIGQDKKVFVYKLITVGTVEEKIQELQKRKQEIADALFSGKSDAAAKLSAADLEALFAPL